jgi:triacylglycerol lipase
MAFDPQFEINVMWPAANAAYLIMSSPSPALPAGYTLVESIVADTREAAPAAAAVAQRRPDQLRIVQAMLSDSPIFGLVAFNDSIKTAIVAIRGTQTIWDWIDDLDAVAVPYLPVPGAGFVHMGFQLVYEHIRSNVGRILKKCGQAQRVVVTGHSLGGAAAILAGVDIAKNVTPTVVPELHTLAGPRTGAPDFQQFFNNLIPTCYRIVNFMDVVPQLPLPPLYEHVGTEELVYGGFKPLDVTYAHHLTTYLAGLQKL